MLVNIVSFQLPFSLYIYIYMSQKELEKLCDTLIPVAVAPLTNGVCYEEQLLGQLP